MTSQAASFRLCSSCKRPIPFGASYFVCSVSTCNRSKTALYFCSLPCFSAHVPMLRHREAWAEEKRAPTLAAFEAQLKAEQDEQRQAAARDRTRSTAAAEHSNAGNEELLMSENEILIVVSKVKGYIKARAGMNTADAVSEAISDLVRKACDDAIARAKTDGRKTVMARDVTGGSQTE